MEHFELNKEIDGSLLLAKNLVKEYEKVFLIVKNILDISFMRFLFLSFDTIWFMPVEETFKFQNF